MALEKELKTYQEKLGELLEHQGKYVVICGDQVVGFFNDYEDALTAGYKSCGVDVEFLVKKVEQDETVHFFRRDVIEPCHPSVSK